NAVLTTAYGTLTLTGFSGDASGGTISYSYTLNNNVDNDTVGDGNGYTDSFAVVVTDVDDSSANSSLDIQINDDVPSAVNDSNSVTEDGPLTASGNVLSNDSQGADGATVTTIGTFTGTYGTLMLYSDGSYTYTLNNNLAAVQGLSEGETLLDTFNYSLVDGDGDTSGAVLTITINGADDGVTLTGLDGEGGEQVVFEANLADGSNPDAGSLTQSGSFSFESVDGLQSISIGGQSFTLAELQALAGSNAVLTTAFGTLTLTGFSGDASGGTISYSYTLTGQVDNDSQSGATGDGYTDSFAVVVTDVDGSTANGSLDVAINDDAPQAVDDVANQGAEDAAVIYNVLSNDTLGADGASLTGAVLTQGSGSVAFNSDGTVTYTPAAGEDGTVIITYTLTDGDGDTDQATLTINLGDDSTPTLSVQDAQLDETGGLDSNTYTFSASYGN
ncbi:beta strand repeat-containing protein, partial [Gallaecimonas pentaromativorans]|uniref:beta strand repeat-containing protein n=1 Tax=Gallaecimonas pentaromativorans TaxID=584787 RepID=UPI001472F36A